MPPSPIAAGSLQVKIKGKKLDNGDILVSGEDSGEQDPL